MRRTLILSLVLGMMSLLAACTNPSETAPTDPANAPGGVTDPSSPAPDGMTAPASPAAPSPSPAS